MKNYLNVIGKEIVDFKTGKPIAFIEDLVFDTDKGLLKAIITNKNKILLFENINEWKIKIYIQSEVLLQNIDDVIFIKNILQEKISILGNKIINEDSVMLGYCEDIQFDEQTGTILKIFGEKYLLDFIPTKSFDISITEIISIEKNKILVKSTSIKDALPET